MLTWVGGSPPMTYQVIRRTQSVGACSQQLVSGTLVSSSGCDGNAWINTPSVATDRSIPFPDVVGSGYRDQDRGSAFRWQYVDGCRCILLISLTGWRLWLGRPSRLTRKERLDNDRWERERSVTHWHQQKIDRHRLVFLKFIKLYCLAINSLRTWEVKTPRFCPVINQVSLSAITS